MVSYYCGIVSQWQYPSTVVDRQALKQSMLKELRVAQDGFWIARSSGRPYKSKKKKKTTLEKTTLLILLETI